MSQPTLSLATIISSEFQENSYLAHLEGRNDCLVIDPGLEPERILAHLDEARLTPVAILNTHGHMDHIAGNAALKARYPDCPLLIGVDEAYKLTDTNHNLSELFGYPMVSPPADRLVTDGDVLDLAGFTLRVLSVPGHSFGHVTYLWEQHEPPIAFVGDVIFAGAVGRHDFPTSDLRQLVASIRDKLFTLPDDTILYSGHGPATTVGREKRSNPFVGFRSLE